MSNREKEAFAVVSFWGCSNGSSEETLPCILDSFNASVILAAFHPFRRQLSLLFRLVGNHSTLAWIGFSVDSFKSAAIA